MDSRPLSVCIGLGFCNVAIGTVDCIGTGSIKQIFSLRNRIPLCFCAVKCDARQTPAKKERINTDARHTIPYRDARQTTAPRERIRADARHTVRDRDARQTTATGERTINRHRDFSFFLDSGAAFIVTPLL